MSKNLLIVLTNATFFCISYLQRGIRASRRDPRQDIRLVELVTAEDSICLVLAKLHAIEFTLKLLHALHSAQSQTMCIAPDNFKVKIDFCKY